MCKYRSLGRGKICMQIFKCYKSCFFPSKLRLIYIFDKFNSVFMEYLLLAFSDCTKHNSEDTDMHVMLMQGRISWPSTTIPVFLRIKAFKLYFFKSYFQKLIIMFFFFILSKLILYAVYHFMTLLYKNWRLSYIFHLKLPYFYF